MKKRVMVETACRKCERKDVRHFSLGYCKRCYKLEYMREYRERMRKRAALDK